MIKTLFLSVTAVLSLKFAGQAQESESSPVAETAHTPMELAARLSGSWLENHEGRLTEEIWTTAEGSLMVGMRRVAREGRPTTIEYMSLTLPDADVLTQWIAGDPPRTLSRLPSRENSAELHFKESGAPYRQVFYRFIDKGLVRTGSEDDGASPIGETTYLRRQTRSMNLDFWWLTGRWRQDTDTGFSEEIWSETGGGSLSGLNRTVSGSETRAFEFMEIALYPNLDTPPSFIARPQGGESVVFTLVEQGRRSATFANQSNAYPTHIRYSRDGNTLTARIWGQGGEAAGREWVWVRVE